MGPIADRDLLFGLTALAAGFVDRRQLAAAIRRRQADASPPLIDVLVQDALLSAEDRAALEAVVQRQLRRHDGDIDRCLSAFSQLAELREELAAAASDAADVSATVSAASTHDSSAAWNELTVVPDASNRDPSPGPQGAAALRFRILRQHARGGLGEVFVARDTELNRDVALKEIQARFADDADSRRRFLLEAEVTGALEHPGIVPVYGLGRYRDGRPFYAMRFIRGDSLRQAADAFHGRCERDNAGTASADDRRGQARAGDFHGVPFRQLLGRFIDVCQAMEYAHSRGVLHRDLKPGNIMLGRYGETLVVDWGLARARGQSESTAVPAETPLRPAAGSGSAPTQMGSTIGTPAFMPPEQADGRLTDLGPASDVYSLGATLYYILTGQPPVSGDSVPDILDRVVQGDVTPPSRVVPQVPKALEAVCRRAMRVDASQRYPSASALAEEIERWLADEPVQAFREPLRKRAARWIRRHRTLVSSAAAAVAVGVAVLSGAAVLLKLANDDLNLANQEIRNRIAEVRRAEATASAINQFLTRDLLQQADPEQNPYRERTTVVQLLDRAAEAVERDTVLRSEPEVEAAVRHTIGVTYFSLGQLEKSERHLVRCVALREQRSGEEQRPLLESLHALGEVLALSGQPERARHLVEQAVARSASVVDDDDPLAVRLQLLHAEVLGRLARYDEARVLAERTLNTAEQAAAPQPALINKCRLVLAGMLAQRLQDFQRARALHESTLQELQERGFAEDSPEVLRARAQLAELLGAYGRARRAETLMREVVELRTQKFPADHPWTLSDRIGLAVVRTALREFNAAAALLADARARAERTLGPDHYISWLAREHSASLLMAAAQHVPRTAEAIARAEQLERDNLATCERQGWSVRHADGFATRWTLATVLQRRGKNDEARQLLEPALEDLIRVHGRSSIDSLALGVSLAGLHMGTGNVEQAERDMEGWLQVARDVLPPEHNGRGYSCMALGNLRLLRGDPDAAEPLLLEFLDFCRKSELARPDDLQGAIRSLANCADAQDATRHLAQHRFDRNLHYRIRLDVDTAPATLLLRNPLGFITTVAEDTTENGVCEHDFSPTLSFPYSVEAVPLGQPLEGAAWRLEISSGRFVTASETSGRLDAASPRDRLLTGSPRGEHEFAGAAGDRWQVRVSSDDFDPFVRVETASEAVVGSDNDSGPGRSAQTEFTPASDTRYRIIVLPTEPTGVGEYTLRLSRFTSEDPALEMTGEFAP